MKNICEGDSVSYRKNNGKVIKFIPALSGMRTTEGKGSHTYTRKVEDYERFDRVMICFREYGDSASPATILISVNKVKKV